MKVIYEDNHLLVVNKPAGIPTQPDDTGQPNLEDQIKEWLKIKYKKPGNVFAGAPHRLDKPVSGVVVFAKTSKALARLHECVRQQQTEKIYLALVSKALMPPEGILEHLLKHDEYRAIVTTQGGKIARLHYRTKGHIKEHILLEITLETGRYHQIRAQLAAEGAPIVGDSKYGSKISSPSPEAICLHHWRFTIPHPITKNPMTFEAAPPSWANMST